MKACIYARKSTNKLGQNETIDNKIGICKHKAKEYGLEIVDIKADTGTGTDDINRPEVKALISGAINGDYQCVIMKGISRFYRDTEKGLGLIKTLERNGVRVIAIEESFDSTEQRTGTGKLDLSRITMYLMFAEMESKKTADRVKFQQLEKARKGQWNNASSAPFGYRYNPETKKLDVNITEAQIVSLIYELYEQGYGTRRLANYLEGDNSDGHIYASPSNNRWTVDTVAYVLKNKTYTGDVVYNQRSRRENVYKRNHKLKNIDKDMWVGNVKNKPEEWIVCENAHESIIGREQFNRVQNIQSIKSKNKGIRRDFSLFAGIAKCGVCGGGLSLKKRKWNKEIPYKNYYYCTQYVKYGKKYCSNHRIEEETLESEVISHLMSLKDDEVVLKQFKEQNKSAIDNTHSSKLSERIKIEAAINNVANKMDSLLEKNIEGLINDTQFKTMNIKYSNELDSLTTKLQEIVRFIDGTVTQQSKQEQDDLLLHTMKKVGDYWNFDKEEKRTFLIQAFNRIVLQDGDTMRLDIEYNFEF